MKIVNGPAAKECDMPVDKQYPYEFEVRSLSGAGDATSPYKFSAPFKVGHEMVMCPPCNSPARKHTSQLWPPTLVH